MLRKQIHKAIKEAREIAKQWTADGNEFWALTASPKAAVEAFRHDNQISEFDFYYGDNTNLKSIIRSNPGLLLDHRYIGGQESMASNTFT